MLYLVVALVVTNLATLVALGLLTWRRFGPVEHPRPSPAVAAAVDAVVPEPTTSSARHVITIEILNPVELARTRGRLAGLAGSLAPGLARRLVLDQAVQMIRATLREERAVADVRVHVVARPPR